MLDSLCTCEEWWQGQQPRPECRVHPPLYDAAAAAWDEAVLRARSGAAGVADTPESDLDRTIAHLYATAAESNWPHLKIHAAAAAKAAGDAVLLRHHLSHALGHQRGISEHLGKLEDALRRRIPEVGRQLDALAEADPGNRSATEHVPRAALDMSLAHDLENSMSAAAHVGRHLSEAQSAQAAGNQDSVVFNARHYEKHIGELGYHLGELRADLIRRIPAVGAELDKLRAVADPARSYADDLAWQREQRGRRR